MDGISKYLRWRNTAVGALVAAGLVLTAMSGSASATCLYGFCTKNLSVGIRNSSKTAIKAQFCPGHHANNPGNIGANPCDTVTYSRVINPGENYTFSHVNPLGIIITAQRADPWDPVKLKTLYFYVKNPDIGLPFFRAQGREVQLEEGQADVRHVNDVKVELRRYADEDRDKRSVKLMRILIQEWPGAVRG
jgi:hypothetical protein